MISPWHIPRLRHRGRSWASILTLILVALVLPNGLPVQGQEDAGTPSSDSPAAQDDGSHDARENPDTQGPYTLRLSLEPREITVGDRVTALLELVPATAQTVADQAEPRFPAWQESWGQAEIVQAGPVLQARDAQGQEVWRQEVILTAFEVGEVQLPAMTVAVPSAGSTLELRTPGDQQFVVRSVLPPPATEEEATVEGATGGESEATEPLEPRPPANPIALESSLFFPLLALALLLLALLSAWRLLSRGQEDMEQSPEEALARLEPLEELRARLAELVVEQPERTHTGISLALRRFLGRRLAFPAVESTTSEIRRQLRGSEAAREHGSELLSLLQACDGVKFARARVDRNTTEDRIRRADRVAEAIEQRVLDLEALALEAESQQPEAA